MAVTAASLAAALGVEETEGARLLPIATALVAAYLRNGTAPDAIRDEAIIRTAGHVWGRDLTLFGAVEGRHKIGPVQTDLAPAAVSPVRQSGAAALLAPYVRRTA